MRTGGGDWTIVQRIDLTDLTQANVQILEDLEGGASGVDLVVSGDRSDFGLPVETLGDFETLFKNVELELIDVRLEAGRRTPALLDLFFGSAS